MSRNRILLALLTLCFCACQGCDSSNSFFGTTPSSVAFYVDRPNVDSSSFFITETEDGEASTRFIVQNMPSFTVSTAEVVEERLPQASQGGASFLFREGYNGAEAFIYTVFLHNTSPDDFEIQYRVTQDQPEDQNQSEQSPLDFARILLQIPGRNAYYGRPSRTMNELGDYRSPISSYSGDGGDVVSSTFASEGNDGYCINFEESLGSNVIIQSSIVLPKESVTRFSFVFYLEGEDAECTRNYPAISFPHLSLHFLK